MRLAALVLAGVLTLPQEIDRLVEMLRIDEAGISVDGVWVASCTADAALWGGLVIHCTADANAHTMSSSDVQDR